MPYSLLAAAPDPSDMRGAIRAFPDHLEEGWQRGEAVDGFDLDAAQLDGIVVCGMGGSAIGGDLVRTLVEPSSPVPFFVNRGYALPGWVSPSTLVVASSYSGGTEETLSAFGEAEERGAQIVAVTSGGELQDRADADRVIEISGGLQPRAALGYSLGVLLRLADALGLADVADMDGVLRECRQRAERLDRDEDDNVAHRLSADLEGALPVVYTGVGLLEAVGMRWRTQIHENAKHPAVGNVLPELDHNEIMGFESGPPEVLGRMQIVALRDRDDHAQVQKRFDATRSLVQGSVGGWHEVETDGATRLGRMLSLVQLGDWASFWLAARKGVDPTPVETIQELKKTLA
jgi:glucose/mannose-6-phosphate isomerase